MTVQISQNENVQKLFDEACGFNNDEGNTRVKTLMRRIVNDIAKIVEDLEVTEDEFWFAVDYLNRLGKDFEVGLLVAGLGLEHFLDLLGEAKDAQIGITGGTPRTIEGPLYVAGAPLCEGEARMDDGSETDATVMFLEGQVVDADGKPVAGATVDLWHANTKGNYSYFDKSQSAYNLRRRIITDADGRYKARTIVPSGYCCRPDGPTQEALNLLGRHGNRPSHVHFFISAPGYRHLTTQINLSHDPYLWDDYAYATRDGVVGEIRFIEDAAAAAARGVQGRFAEVDFDFQLVKAVSADDQQRSKRPRALQLA